MPSLGVNNQEKAKSFVPPATPAKAVGADSYLSGGAGTEVHSNVEQSDLDRRLEEFKRLRQKAQMTLPRLKSEDEESKDGRSSPHSENPGCVNPGPDNPEGGPPETIPGLTGGETPTQMFVKVKDAYFLEDFRIVVKLGKGAFGNVYLIELDPNLNAAPN